MELGQIGEIQRAKRPQRLPVVLTRQEVQKVLNGVSGTCQLMAKLLYGTGMRLMECVRLRVKDVEFEKNQIVVREGKGFKDRVTILPEAVKPALAGHLKRVKLLHEKDLAGGNGRVYLPYALKEKYPAADREWAWQYVFPAAGLPMDPRSGVIRRHHKTFPMGTVLEDTTGNLYAQIGVFDHVKIVIPPNKLPSQAGGDTPKGSSA